MVTSNMTKEERHEAIMDQFFKQNVVLVSDLADKLGVSSVTIRKDLTELEKEGKLYRSHGKAIAINPFANNRSVNEKEHYCPEEKHRIGMEATKLIEDNHPCVCQLHHHQPASHCRVGFVAGFCITGQKRECRHHTARRYAAPQQSLGRRAIQ